MILCSKFEFFNVWHKNKYSWLYVTVKSLLTNCKQDCQLEWKRGENLSKIYVIIEFGEFCNRKELCPLVRFLSIFDYFMKYLSRICRRLSHLKCLAKCLNPMVISASYFNHFHGNIVKESSINSELLEYHLVFFQYVDIDLRRSSYLWKSRI